MTPQGKRRRKRFESLQRIPALDPIEQEVGTRRRTIRTLFREAARRWRDLGNELSEEQEMSSEAAYLERRSVPIQERPIPPYVSDLLNARRKTLVGQRVDRKKRH